MAQANHYDYIFTGAGCAGMSLLMRMIRSRHADNKRILVIEPSLKNINDRTWCFWEKGEGYFESIVHRSWSHLKVSGSNSCFIYDTSPYRYKMIRGIDFYNHCVPVIKSHPSITFLQEKAGLIGNNPPLSPNIMASGFVNTHTPGDAAGLRHSDSLLSKSHKRTFVNTPSGNFTADYVFNSIFEKPLLQRKHVYLLQHFKGFVIRTASPAFDPSVGTLMDFRTCQDQGTAFVYVLPMSDTEALVEYTMFTENLLPADAYDAAVHEYIKNVLHLTDYEVVSKEFGVIPMTDYPFPTHNENIINIGTAGGVTKPSTGYTFSYIQKQADTILHQLQNGHFPVTPPGSRAKKFRWYDAILLHVLAARKIPGEYVFTQLFRKNHIRDVFAFLDNDTNLRKDFTIIKTLPPRVFARQGLKILWQNL